MQNWGPLRMERQEVSRRAILTGAMAGTLLFASGCASVSPLSYDEAVRRLLVMASQDAFARLVAPDGFWDSAVARIELPDTFGKRGSIMEGMLKSAAVRERLQREMNRFAEDGARRAAPVVADTIRTIGIRNAMALIKGDPTAATSFLRDSMGTSLVGVMVPELEGVMKASRDPLLNQAVSLLTGVKIGDAANALAVAADNAIWHEIGVSEARIRANPRATNDTVLMAALALT